MAIGEAHRFAAIGTISVVWQCGCKCSREHTFTVNTSHTRTDGGGGLFGMQPTPFWPSVQGNAVHRQT